VVPRPDRRQGTEPLSARSPLRLRAVLSIIALVGGTALAVAFWVAGSGTAAWIVIAIGIGTAVIAVIDLWVIARRARRWPKI